MVSFEFDCRGFALVKIFSGTLDYECWVTNERRIVVDEKEWEQLIAGIFEPEHFWSVSVDELPCTVCESGYLVRFISDLSRCIGTIYLEADLITYLFF